jgi:hypothetical protein
MAIGAVAIAYDKDEASCADTAKDVLGHCPRRWNTRWWSLSLMGLGAASATAGGLMLFFAPGSGLTRLGAGYRTTF